MEFFKNRIRYINMVLFTAVLFLSLPAVSHSESRDILTEEERIYLKNLGPVIFVSQTVYPPFEFVEEVGEHTGMCIELARWMATELGFKTVFTDMAFTDAQQAVLSGKAHVLTSLFFSEKRDRFFEFTDTIFEVPASVFVASDRPDIRGIEDLNDKTVAMQKGDYALEFLESKHISVNVSYTADFFEATDQIIARRADAIIGDEQIVLYHLYSARLSEHVKKVGAPLYIGQNCMAVSEGNTILRAILNKGITMARNNGVLDGIQRKWLGVRLSAEESFYSKYKVYILGLPAGLVMAILLIWFWNIRLRKEVVLRTEDLLRSENTLREKEKFLNTVIENIPNMIFVKDAEELRFIRFNRAGEELLGYSREELGGKNDYDFFPKEEADFFTEKDREVLRCGKVTDIPEEKIQTRNMGTRILHTKKIPVFDDAGEPQYLLGISEDITEHLRAEKERKRSEERLMTAITVIDEGFAIYDSEDRLAMCNKQFLDIYKDSSHILHIGKRFEDMIREGVMSGNIPEAFGREEEWIAERVARHRCADSSVEQKQSDGRWIRISERKTEDGSTVSFHVDITEIKQSEERMLAALKEKETLLKEIHHRVKNNMQVVLSLLSLQALKLDNDLLSEAFLEAQNRVQSMAIVHEILYQSDNFDKIDLQSYLESLTAHLFHAFASHTGQITKHIDAGKVKIGIDQAVPCGLIITELLTNALKYAFPSGDGEIQIICSSENGNSVRLIIADNGIGLHRDFDPSASTTLGMRLVTELIEEQLEGTWQLETEGGTRWSIRWMQ